MLHLKKAKDGQFYYVLKAKNGKVRMTSETHTRKRNAVEAMSGAVSDFCSVVGILSSRAIKPGYFDHTLGKKKAPFILF